MHKQLLSNRFSMLSSITKEQYDQLNRELHILRDYSKALEAQNKTRNEQRLILEKQIERLSQLEKLAKQKKILSRDQTATISTTTVSNNGSCLDCLKYKSEIMKLENTIERLRRENANLQSSYNVLSETLTKYNASMNINTYTKASLKESQLCESNITLGPNKLSVTNSEYEKRYKELLTKYDELSTENLNLKRNMEQTSKSNYQKQQQSITKLQSQKQSLNIRISTLELQIHNLKSTISTKDNQIFTYKNKQSLTNSSLNNLQSEIKATKQNLASKQRQLAGYKERINGMIGVQSDLQHVRTLLVNKDIEINNYKIELRKIENFQGKISQLEGQIRNLKYQINTKDGQLIVLKSKLQLSSNDLNKNSSLELQLRSTKISLSNKDLQINNLRSQLSQLANLRSQVTQIPYLRSQISSLQKQLKNYQLKYQEREKSFRETHQSQKSNSATINQYSEQIYKLNNQVVKLQSELRQKQNYIVRIQDQLKQRIKKNQENDSQLKKYDKIVESYIQKIGQLQIQLEKLDNSSLRSSNQISNKDEFNMLVQENHVLNQKIQDLQRRISILEGANLSLREELRISIDMRARQTSRLIVSNPMPAPAPTPPLLQDEQLINTIKILKMQLDDLRAVNNKLRSQNEYLQAKLSSCELQIENLTNISKMAPIRLSNQKSREKQFNIIKTNQILANVPMIETTHIQASQIKNESNINPKVVGQMRSYQGYTSYGNSEKDSHFSVKNSVKTPSKIGQSKQRLKWKSRQKRANVNPIHNKAEKIVQITNISDGHHIIMKGPEQKEYEDLQRKIQLLKHENKGLRKHLFNSKN